HPDAPRAAGPAPELPADIDRVGRPRALGKVPAVPAAIHPELEQLVVDAEGERARQVRRIGGEKLEVARGDARNRVAIDVGAIEIAVVDQVYRTADHADAARGEVRTQHVAATGDQRGGVQRELV